MPRPPKRHAAGGDYQPADLLAEDDDPGAQDHSDPSSSVGRQFSASRSRRGRRGGLAATPSPIPSSSSPSSSGRASRRRTTTTMMNSDDGKDCKEEGMPPPFTPAAAATSLAPPPTRGGREAPSTFLHKRNGVPSVETAPKGILQEYEGILQELIA